MPLRDALNNIGLSAWEAASIAQHYPALDAHPDPVALASRIATELKRVKEAGDETPLKSAVAAVVAAPDLYIALTRQMGAVNAGWVVTNYPALNSYPDPVALARLITLRVDNEARSGTANYLKQAVDVIASDLQPPSKEACLRASLMQFWAATRSSDDLAKWQGRDEEMLASLTAWATYRAHGGLCDAES